jgi:hypothetical protein
MERDITSRTAVGCLKKRKKNQKLNLIIYFGCKCKNISKQYGTNVKRRQENRKTIKRINLKSYKKTYHKKGQLGDPVFQMYMRSSDTFSID